jgi:hypothetical protein
MDQVKEVANQVCYDMKQGKGFMDFEVLRTGKLSTLE